MIFLAIVLISLTVFYCYGIRTFNYWKNKEVKHIKPVPYLGNCVKNVLMQKSISQIITEIYYTYPNEKVVGFYRFDQPELILRDPQLVKRVLTTDFYIFNTRGLLRNKNMIYNVLRNVFHADGDLWRLLRQRMTPAFTSGKLKAMFPLILERAELLQERAVTLSTAGHPLDARDLMARYTIDFIGACGFGIEAKSLKVEDSAFRKLGNDIFHYSTKRYIVFILKQMFPNIFAFIKPMHSVQATIKSLLKAILKEREYKFSGRNDFIDLLIDIKNKGTITGESIENFKSDGTPEVISLEMDEDLMVAQMFIFLAAGFETSSSATSCTLHLLAYHPKVQKMVQKEIDMVLARHNNKLSYDAVKEMTYLNWTFQESMRLYPILGYLTRRCIRKYTFPEYNLTIDKGVRVIIPVQALQNDPKYFSDPKEFRPERFSPEELNAEQRSIYLPFGGGPRTCLGERLGQMQSLAGLAAVLSKMSVEPAPESLRYPDMDPKCGDVQNIKGGLPLLFKTRN